MIKTRMKQLKTLFLLKLFMIFSRFTKSSDEWVVCERGTDARDNGWHFYNFMKKKHPEIKVHYIIDKKSSDYEKVKEDAVQYGSLKNFWVVAKAKKIVSTHIAMCLPNLYGKPWKYSGIDHKFYFLQHGIICNDLIPLHKDRAPMKLFFCGAYPEYEYVRESFGHEEGVVQYTGLARYDNLHCSITKKQILVMPTWRRYIKSRDDFMLSDYYKNWQSLLLDKELCDELENNEYELIFYLHYEFQKYSDCFINNSPFIKIASFNDYDVQKLLKESKLLITDFSSVFFDFAYMKKPTIYFQFDSEKFFDVSYKKGYFDHEKDGFGKVCHTSDSVIREMKKCFDNQFNLEAKYEERIKEFFPLYDQNNCQRIFEKIIEE